MEEVMKEIFSKDIIAVSGEGEEPENERKTEESGRMYVLGNFKFYLGHMAIKYKCHIQKQNMGDLAQQLLIPFIARKWKEALRRISKKELR